MESTTQSLERIARDMPRTTALIAEGRTVSYAELLEETRVLAEALQAANLDTVALLADNSIDWVIADLAAQLAAVTLVPLPGFFSPLQMQHAVRDSGACAVLVDRRMTERHTFLSCARVEIPSDRLVCHRLSARTPASALPRGTAKISYTSGTTGEPKGVCLTQAAMDTVAASLVTATSDLGLRRHLCLLPLATLLENVAGVFAPLRIGSEICTPSLATVGWTGSQSLDASRLLQAIAQCAPDSVILVPQMLHGLLEALEGGAAAPASLTFVAVGGAHVAPALLDRAERLGLPVFEGYGLTETASVVAISSPKRRRRGSVGRPLAHSDVRIDASGEIIVRGATYAGYVGETEMTATEVATGDLGRIDEDGYLYVLGRRKNVFITSFGRNVSPDWVEAEFAKMPSVSQLALFGEGRPWNTAVIVPSAAASRAALEVDIALVNATLPDYARIGDWILADRPFSASNGLATSNGRNRREAIWRVYGQRICARYDLCVSRRA